MNSDAQPLLNGRSVKDAEIDIRRGFVRKVYGILTAQLLLTLAIAAPLSQAVEFVATNEWLLWLSSAMTLVTMISMVCCQKVTRSFPTNYLCLFLFTAFMAVTVGFACALYTAQSVLIAVGITVGIFACLTIFACVSSTDFTGAGPYLFAALAGLCVFGFVLTILSWCGVTVEWVTMLYNVLGAILFSFYIVFDTQLILGEWGGHKTQFGVDDYVFAALNLYLDIINLFLVILEIMGKRRN